MINDQVSKEDDLKQDCLPYYFDSKLVSEIRPYLAVICPILITIELIVLVASFKWTKFAHGILYLQSIYQVAISLSPNGQYIYGPLLICGLILFSFLAYYTGSAI